MDLGLVNEEIKLISANHIRATVLTESLKACYVKYHYYSLLMLLLMLLLLFSLQYFMMKQ